MDCGGCLASTAGMYSSGGTPHQAEHPEIR
jgi:hypothetical protein